MKIQKLEIKAFRGFLDVPVFSLDGDIILLAGNNGLGKTTFFDAFEWCLTGKLKRYDLSPIEKRQHPYIVNRFANRDAFVKISFIDGQNTIEFIREGNEKKTNFSIKVNGKPIPSKKVKKKELEILVADEELLGQIKEEDIEYLLLRSHLLEQELTAEFIRSVSPTSRFSQLSKILGADRFEAFYKKISSSYKFIDEELSFLEKELQTLIRQLNEKKASLERERELSEKLPGIMSKELIYHQCLIIAQRLGILSPNIPNINEEWINFELIEFCYIIQDYCKRLLNNAEKLLEEIATGKAALSDIKRKYKDIDHVIEAMKKYKSNLENLMKNKFKFMNEKASLAKKLRAIEKEEKNVDESVRQPRVQLDMLIFLYNNLNQYQTNKRESEQLTSEISNIPIKINTQLNSLNILKQEHESKRSVLESCERDKVELVNELKKWNSIKEKHGQLKDLENNSKTLKNDLAKFKKVFTEERDAIKHLEILLTTKEKDQRAISEEFNTMAQKVNEYVQLLGRLRVLINSKICPLCGHEWGSKKQLLDKVDKMSSQEKKLISINKAKLSNIEKQISGLTQQFKERQATALSLKKKLDTSSKELEGLKENEQKLIEEILLLGLSKKQILDMKKEFIEQYLISANKQMDDLDQNIAAIKKDLAKKSRFITELSDQVNRLEINRETKKKKLENLMTFIRDFEKKADEIEISKRELSKLKIVLDQTEQRIKELNQKLGNTRKQKEMFLAKIQHIDDKIDGLEERRENTKQTLDASEEQIHEFSSKLKKFKLERYSQIPEKLTSLETNENKISQIVKELKNLIESIDYLRGKEKFELLIKDVQKLEQRVNDLQEKVDGIKASRRLAKRLNQAARKETRNVIGNLIKAHEPLINNFYHQVNPHPRFTTIRFVPKSIPGRGGGNAVFIEAIDDFDQKVINPSLTFSSAQLNVLAISIFLAIHTNQAWCKLDTILMDDPIQNMDDLNILSYIDLIRRIRKNKQIIISTHDDNIYRLMRRKFQPSKGEQLICYEYKTFKVNGPEIVAYRFPS